MPEYQLIDNRRKEAAVVQGMRKKLDGFNSILLKKIAAEIVALSPVDTGTYMENHVISDGRKQAPAKASSHGKPRNQPRGSYEGEAISRLYAQIESLPDEAIAFVANTAVHAKAVEYGGWNWNRGPYAVYRTARSKIGVFSREAAMEARNL